MSGAAIAVQLTLDELVTVNACVSELRNGAERARADGRLAYGNELARLADELVSLLIEVGTAPKLVREVPKYCTACGLKATTGHWTGCPAGAES